MLDCHDDIPSLAALVDIGVRLSGLLEWIYTIDDRLELSGLGQLGEKLQIFSARYYHPSNDLFAARP